MARSGGRPAKRSVPALSPDVAFGVALPAEGGSLLDGFRVAVRVLERTSTAGLLVQNAKQRAHGEVDEVFVGPIESAVEKGCFRPCVLGSSVGHPDVTAGTLGAFVNREGEVHLLSNNHILANCNTAKVNDAVLQPGPLDGGKSPDHEIARLTYFVPLDDTAANQVDAAVARLIDQANFTIAGSITGVRSASTLQKAEKVGKVGRSTSRTAGTVRAVHMLLPRVGYGGARTFAFEEQIELEGIGGMDFAHDGDSGAVVFDGDGVGVGLLFAVAAAVGFGYANSLEEVLTRVDATLIGG